MTAAEFLHQQIGRLWLRVMELEFEMTARREADASRPPVVDLGTVLASPPSSEEV